MPVLAQRIGTNGTMVAHTNGYLYWMGVLGDVVRADPTSGSLATITTGAFGIALTEGPDQFLYTTHCLASDGVGACGTVQTTTDIVVRRVDPASGLFTTVGLGPIGKPRDVAFDRRDSMYVESANDRRFFRFHPVTGASGAFPLSGSENSYTVLHMAGHPDGNLYQTHNYTTGGRVDRMDPVTNARSSLSTFPATTGLGAITVVRDYTVPAQRRSWSQVKQLYR